MYTQTLARNVQERQRTAFKLCRPSPADAQPAKAEELIRTLDRLKAGECSVRDVAGDYDADDPFYKKSNIISLLEAMIRVELGRHTQHGYYDD